MIETLKDEDGDYAGTRTFKLRGGMAFLGATRLAAAYRFGNGLALLDNYIRGKGPEKSLGSRFFDNYAWHTDLPPGHPMVHGAQTFDQEFNDFWNSDHAHQLRLEFLDGLDEGLGGDVGFALQRFLGHDAVGRDQLLPDRLIAARDDIEADVDRRLGDFFPSMMLRKHGLQPGVPGSLGGLGNGLHQRLDHEASGAVPARARRHRHDLSGQSGAVFGRTPLPRISPSHDEREVVVKKRASRVRIL